MPMPPRPEAGFAGREANSEWPCTALKKGARGGKHGFPHAHRAMARSTASASSGESASDGRPRSSSFTYTRA